MRRVILSLLAVGLMALPALAQCGPNGCNLPRDDGWRVVPNRQPATIERSREREVTKTRPTPAWRYEWATGHRAAVVRVECRDGMFEWSKGSGVLVRWGNRIVILTARHVVKDAKEIHVKFHNGKKHKAKVLKVDKRWDCAVLDIGGQPVGIKPAELAYGNDAKFHEGDRLETCGYGPDEKLASNSGLFIGYRRSSESPDEGPDDWMAVSGPARQGDSGGPVFDAKGHVVGVLWGTDGQTVICVQPGRIHALLTEVTAEQLAIRDRQPTPPAYGPLEPVNPGGGCGPGGCPGGQCDVDQAGLRNKEKPADTQPLLPWRGDAVKDQKAQDARIEALIRLQENQRRQGASVDVRVGPQQPMKPPANALDPSIVTWVIVLCALVGVVLAGIIRWGIIENE